MYHSITICFTSIDFNTKAPRSLSQFGWHLNSILFLAGLSFFTSDERHYNGGFISSPGSPGFEWQPIASLMRLIVGGTGRWYEEGLKDIKDDFLRDWRFYKWKSVKKISYFTRPNSVFLVHKSPYDTAVQLISK